MKQKPTIFQLILASLLIAVITLQMTRQSGTEAETTSQSEHTQQVEGGHHHGHDDHGSEEDHHSHEEGDSNDHHHHHDHQHVHGQASEETLWNLRKAEVLRQTMITYRPVKQGQYKEYWVGTGLKWQGVALPDKVLTNIGDNSPLQTLVDGQSQALQYSQTAEEAGWKVVAVFSNQADQSASEHHTYLFVIKEDGQALVIEPVTSDGKSISFTSQVDDKLVSDFVALVAGD